MRKRTFWIYYNDDRNDVGDIKRNKKEAWPEGHDEARMAATSMIDLMSLHSTWRQRAIPRQISRRPGVVQRIQIKIDK